MQRRPNPSGPRLIEPDDFSPELREVFRTAAAQVKPFLTLSSQRAWAAVGQALARSGPGAQEVTLAYLRASPAMAAALTSRRFLHWARLGRKLVGTSARAATAFYQASPSALHVLDPAHLGAWAELGLRLCQTATGGDLVARFFFEASPRLLQHMPLGMLARLARVIQHADPRMVNVPEVLDLAVRLGAVVQGSALTAFLRCSEQVARCHTPALRAHVAAGLSLYARLAAADRPRYLQVVDHLARTTPRGLESFLIEGDRGLGALVETHGMAVLEMLARIASLSTAAAREFVRNAATVAEKLTLAEMDAWCRLGEARLSSRESAGINFFQLQSREALDALTALTPAVDLAEVREVLRLYCQALMGKTIAVVASDRVDGRGAHRSTADEIDWEGAAIFCPRRMHDFPTKEGNFAAYKVLATHQAGHLEFGTFGFRFAGDGRVLHPLRHTLARLLGKDGAYYTEFEQYFDLFPDRRLAHDVFMIAEDTRVDRRVRSEYRGIRHAFQQVQAQALATRPDYAALPLRQQFVEMLVRMSLEAAPVVVVPAAFAGSLTQAAGLVNLLASGQASVEDAAEAAIRLAVVLGAVPNTDPSAYRDQPWVTLDLAQARYDPLAEDHDQLIAAFLDLHRAQGKRPDAYVPMTPVGYRGDLAPEVHQALQKLQRQTRQLAQWQHLDASNGPGSLDDLSDAELLALIEDYFGVSEVMDEDTEMVGSGEHVARFANREEALRFLRSQREMAGFGRRPTPPVGEEEVETAVYDEWDYRARAYRPKWCQVRQRRLREGASAFYEDTLARYRWLVQAVRQQFEMLRPENLGRIKRLHDGDEFDLDAVVEAHVQRRAGQTPSEKIYTRRNKVDRSVAVALLVDLSVSTGEPIESEAARPADEAGSDTAGPQSAPKRIIDLERESIVLFIEALEQIGDAYGIYGFSGSGRDDVQFYVIKEMQEVFTDQVRRRVDTMTALQGTRMGPAIRHTITKLEQVEAKTKVLILLSDGRPQDRDYGALPWDPEALPRSFQHFDEYGLGSVAHTALMLDEKEYAIHDTKQALNEARIKGITPFCISVDKQGRDYLRAMCGDIGYEVVGDIQSLPRQLPALYKQLTT